jgi:hypothetical protein
MNNMSKSPNKGFSNLVFLAPFLFPIIGFFIGLGASHGLNYLEMVPRWRSLPPPPSQPIELVEVSPGCLFIESFDSNHYYFCDHGSRNDDWVSTDKVEQYPDSSCWEGVFPDPPTDVVQVVEYCAHKEYIDNIQFALFDSGTIKMRRINPSIWGSLCRNVLLIIMSSVLGLISGIVLLRHYEKDNL